MTARAWTRCLVGCALLAVGACAREEAPAEPAALPEDQWGYSTVYRDLVDGDGLYVGTIKEVLPERSRPHDHDGERLIEQEGELRFAVERTLFGEDVKELRTHYVCDLPNRTVASDWGGYVWDDHPPRKGMRLLVLAFGKKDRERYAQGVREEGLVTYIWDAPKDSPFIEELAEACGLVTATDVKERIRLVKDLAGSKYPTIRWLVLHGVLGSGGAGEPQPPEAPPELVLEYLRASGATAPEHFDRGFVTEGLVAWFSDRGRADSAGEDLRKAFEDWYVGELDALGQYGHSDMETLGCLCELCEKLGVARTVGLFKRTGREGLIKRLTAYVQSPDSWNGKLVQKLLELLAEK